MKKFENFSKKIAGKHPRIDVIALYAARYVKKRSFLPILHFAQFFPAVIRGKITFQLVLESAGRVRRGLFSYPPRPFVGFPLSNFAVDRQYDMLA